MPDAGDTSLAPKLQGSGHKMFHIFHFLQSEMIIGMYACEPRLFLENANCFRHSRENRSHPRLKVEKIPLKLLNVSAEVRRKPSAFFIQKMVQRDLANHS